MRRKLLGLLLTMTLAMSLLVGCGEGTNESSNDVVKESVNENSNDVVKESTDDGNKVVENQASNSSESEIGTDVVDNTVEEQVGDNDVTAENNSSAEYYTLSLCWDQDLKQSAVVSYDSEKVKLKNLSYNAAEFQWLDKKDVKLLLMCENENPSVEDLYQKEMKSLENDGLSVSELTEKKVGYYTVFRSDGVWTSDGSVGFEFFALELENGMILYAVHMPGFENQVYLEEMLPYVLAYVTEGDGTWMTPPSYDPEEEEDTPDGMEWDTFFEVTSIGGVKVKVYYDPDVIKSCYTYEPEFFLTDEDGNEFVFAIADFATAEARRQGREDYFNSQKMLEDVYVSELSEYQVGEYTIKSYRADYMVYAYDGSGELSPGSFSEDVIELGAEVVCVFNGEYVFDNPETLGVFLNAMKFVVE